jgi:multidrug efflux pump
MSPIEAARKGSNEIFFAVISTSITLAVVFLPVIFMKGFVGKLFQEFGVVLAGSVLISAFVSLTLTPMLNAYLVRKSDEKTRFYTMTEPFFVKLTQNYQRLLNGFLRRKKAALLIIIICGGMIWFFGSKLKSELAPLDDRSWMRVMATAPEGATYEYMDSYIDRMTRMILDSVPENTVCLSVTSPNFMGTGGANTGLIRVVLNDPSKRKRSQSAIAGYLMQQSKNFPDAKAFIIEQQTISTGGFGGLPVQYVIQAPNFNALKEKLPKFIEAANADKTFQVVDVNLKFNKPELNLVVNRDKAQELGVSVIDIAQTLQLAFSPQRMAYFTMDGKQYQVIGQFERNSRNEPLDLKSLYIRNVRGELIQLDNIVATNEQSSPPQLYHYNRYMSATVSAGLSPGKTIGDGIKAMDNISSKMLDDSFSTALIGASRDFSESSSGLSFAFMLALLLVYLVLAAQFESFRDPFIIMITVPLALAGAVFSLWYFNQTLNIFSQIGIIMLIGLVTKNGILIVEFANQLQEKGNSKADAILMGAVSRLRPILMTSIATALGALPIAASLGAASKSRMSMGIVIIGGLLFSLVLTLFVIPAMYSYLAKKRVKHE